MSFLKNIRSFSFSAFGFGFGTSWGPEVNDKKSPFKKIIQNELKSYKRQTEEFFLLAMYMDGAFLQKHEWQRLKIKLPNIPASFENHNLIIEYAPEDIEKISKLIGMHKNILEFIRKVDDIYSTRDDLFIHERIELLKELDFLCEKFMFTSNNLSTSWKYSLPKDSIFQLFE